MKHLGVGRKTGLDGLECSIFAKNNLQQFERHYVYIFSCFFKPIPILNPDRRPGNSPKAPSWSFAIAEDGAIACSVLHWLC